MATCTIYYKSETKKTRDTMAATLVFVCTGH